MSRDIAPEQICILGMFPVCWGSSPL